MASLAVSFTEALYTAAGLPGWLSGEKKWPANAGDAGDSGLIAGLRRFSGGGNSNTPQNTCLGNPMDRGA